METWIRPEFQSLNGISEKLLKYPSYSTRYVMLFCTLNFYTTPGLTLIFCHLLVLSVLNVPYREPSFVQSMTFYLKLLECFNFQKKATKFRIYCEKFSRTFRGRRTILVFFLVYCYFGIFLFLWCLRFSFSFQLTYKYLYMLEWKRKNLLTSTFLLNKYSQEI